MRAIENPAVRAVFESYPEPIREQLMALRQTLLEAAEAEDVGEVEETLKWGQPSYLAKQGSTVRMGWRADEPQRYGLYFTCTTNLVDTFKMLYGDLFQFEGNRAILFEDGEALPIEELKHCMAIALSYHRRKHLPMLGTQLVR